MTINKEALDQIRMFATILASAIDAALSDEEIDEEQEEYINPIAECLSELKEEIDFSQEEISYWLEVKEVSKERIAQEFTA